MGSYICKAKLLMLLLFLLLFLLLSCVYVCVCTLLYVHMVYSMCSFCALKLKLTFLCLTFNECLRYSFMLFTCSITINVMYSVCNLPSSYIKS